MFERFTARARQVVVLAQEEAQLLKHNYLGTEHILLGLLREEVGLSACVLDQLGVKIDDVREFVARLIGTGDEIAVGQVPFTPRTKRVLEGALREALVLGHNYIGTEHLLLGLVRENEGVANRILFERGITPERVRATVMRTLAGSDREGVALTDDEAAALKVEIIRTAAETLRDAAVILETAAQALTEIPA